MNTICIILLSLLFIVVVVRAQPHPGNCPVYSASCAYLYDCTGRAQRCDYSYGPNDDYVGMCNSIGGITVVNNECRTFVDLPGYAGTVTYSNPDCTGTILSASLTLTNTCQRIISSLYYRVSCNGTQLVNEEFGPSCSPDDRRGPTTVSDIGCSNGNAVICDIDECLNPSVCPAGIKCINTVGSFYCNGTREYFIMNAETGLVMTGGSQGADVKMTAQKSQDNDDQLWSYVPSKGGFIVNKRTGYAMDIKYGVIFPGAEVITKVKRDAGSIFSYNQKWIYNATTLAIASKVGDFVLEARSAAENATVILWPHKKTHNSNQQFVLVESA